MNITQARRDLRAIPDWRERHREEKVKRVQASFDLDRKTAAQTLEWIDLKFANHTFSSLCGGVTAYYLHFKFTPMLQKFSLLFKKPWMVPVFPAFGFCCAYVGAREIRARRLMGSDGSFEKMSGSTDILSRFRDLEEVKPHGDNNIEALHNYLTTFTGTTKEEAVKHLRKYGYEVKHKNQEKLKYKRLDGDLDDIKYMFAKIHGLENIAFVDDEELQRAAGDPLLLQTLVHKAEPTHNPSSNFDGLVGNVMCRLEQYKKEVDKLDLTKSDRSKLLFLPFSNNNRAQNPEPKKGQWQYDLFTTMSGGKTWNHYDDLEFDPETKINIFEYEKMLPPSYLKKIDKDAPQFKKQVKMATILGHTEYEKHMELKKTFGKLMNVLHLLNEKEGESLCHLLKNKNGKSYIDALHSGVIESRLAKIAVYAQHEQKNEYLLEKNKLDYIRKDKMPVEKAKIKDVLKNAADFRVRFNDEFGLYDTMEKTMDQDKRLMQIFSITSTGPLEKLKLEIGLRKDSHTLHTLRTKDIQELTNKISGDPMLDHTMFYFFNSTFSLLDMTDYDDIMVGPNEDRLTADSPRSEKYKFINPQDTFYPSVYLEDEMNAIVEEMEEIEEEDEDEDGEDGGEEEEAEKPASYQVALKGNDEVPITEEDREYETPEWPYEVEKKNVLYENGYFDIDETVNDRFNDIEMDSFMKFLNVQPFRNWKDKSSYHNRLGAHQAEDLAQSLDPEFHVVGEVEREAYTRSILAKHRQGSTVRFVVDGKVPRFY